MDQNKVIVPSYSVNNTRYNRFRTKYLKNTTRNFILGAYRVKYRDPRAIGGHDTEVHSYPGPKIDKLAQLCATYPARKLLTVVIVAGFNDSNKMEGDMKDKTSISN